MQEKKLIVIGIDGMDYELVKKFASDMPNVNQLIDGAENARLTSVFPPDSLTAWTSLYTGLNPAEHGQVSFGKHWNSDPTPKEIETGDLAICGKTLWDKANRNGLKTAIVLPYNVYPGWQINGTMICRTNDFTSEDFPLKYFPESQSKKYKVNNQELNMFHGYYSRKQRGELVNKCIKRVIAEQDLTIQVLEGENWNLLFTYFSSLDAIQHNFWDCYDPRHPDYPGPNQYESVIQDVYIMHDKAVGKSMSCIDEKAGVIIVSNHGHGPRPTKLFNVNEFLFQKGYLKLAKGHNQYSSKAKAKLRNVAIKFVQDFGFGALAGRILSLYPKWKQKVSAESSIDWKNSFACISSFSPFKSYSYGGIWINGGCLGTDKDAFISKIIKELSEFKHPKKEEHIVKWVTRRDDLYQGDYLDLYPDIIVELKEGIGFGQEVGGNILEDGKMHKVQPGSHKLDTPVLGLRNIAMPNEVLEKNLLSLMDIAPMALSFLGIHD